MREGEGGVATPGREDGITSGGMGCETRRKSSGINAHTSH